MGEDNLCGSTLSTSVGPFEDVVAVGSLAHEGHGVAGPFAIGELRDGVVPCPDLSVVLGSLQEARGPHPSVESRSVSLHLVISSRTCSRLAVGACSAHVMVIDLP